MGILRLIDGKSVGGGGDGDGQDEGQDNEAYVPPPGGELAEDSGYQGPDADEKTLVVDSASLDRLSRPAGHASPAANGGRPAARVPMPAPARRPAPAQEPDVDMDADTFFEDASDIDRALEVLTSAGAPLPSMEQPEDDEDFEEIEYDDQNPFDRQDDGGVGVGGVGPERMDGVDEGNFGRDDEAFAPQGYDPAEFQPPPPRPLPRAQSVNPWLPLAPPLPPPPPVPLPIMAGMPPDPTGSYQSIPYHAMGVGQVTGSYQVGQVTGSYPTYTGAIPYIVQPVVAAPTPRSAVILVFALIATTAVGIGLGWLLFARGRDDGDMPARVAEPKPAPASAAPAASTAPGPSAALPVQAPAAPAASASPAQPSAPPPPASAAATEPPAGPSAPASEASPREGAVSADVTSLEHPPLSRVVAPLRGEIALSALQSSRAVRKGEKLFEVRRRRQTGGDREEELATRVNELERLAEEDPVYEAFLARARDEHRRAQQDDVTTATVKAASDGVAAPSVGRGDRVKSGQILAVISDPRSWTARAALRGGTVTREWTCAITSPEGSSRAACRIEQVSQTKSGLLVIATVEAGQVPWLRAADQKPRLVLEPPARR